MDARNRIGLYGSYFLGMAGIGFTLPYLPLYLNQRGLDERAIGMLSTLAALAELAQFPVGLASDRLRRRRPFLVAALATLAVATLCLRGARGVVWLVLLVALFAENGACRATVESMTGAVATELGGPDGVGSALGALRWWKPLGVVLMAFASGVVVECDGVAAALAPVAIAQWLAVGCALLLREPRRERAPETVPAPARGPADGRLWIFVVAMVLFHVSNSPGGVYLGLFLGRELHAPARWLSYSFIISNLVWMLVVAPVGRLADRIGRKPMLVAGWLLMSARLAALAIVRAAWQVLAIQVLDGAAQAFFAVVAAAWVTDRLGRAHAGRAQVLVGCCLVLGSAVGPSLAGLVFGALGYRGMFALLAIVGALGTAIVASAVPETADHGLIPSSRIFV